MGMTRTDEIGSFETKTVITGVTVMWKGLSWSLAQYPFQ